jgi:hypothetical protein
MVFRESALRIGKTATGAATSHYTDPAFVLPARPILRTAKEKRMNSPELYSLDEALKAQKALREAAGLAPEQFPIQAFVGMISDEIESLRQTGRTDEDIAGLIRQNSSIKITGAEIARYYATPEERHPDGA